MHRTLAFASCLVLACSTGCACDPAPAPGTEAPTVVTAEVQRLFSEATGPRPRGVGILDLIEAWPEATCALLLERPDLFELLTPDYLAQGRVFLSTPSPSAAAFAPAEVAALRTLLSSSSIRSPEVAARLSRLTTRLFEGEGLDPVAQHVLVVNRSRDPGLRKSSYLWLRAQAGLDLELAWWEPTREALELALTKPSPAREREALAAKLPDATLREQALQDWLRARERR